MILKWLGYVGFFLASFVFCLYLTFPWDSVKQRVLRAASRQIGSTITARSLTPSWLTGFEAKAVKMDLGGEPESPVSFELEKLNARAHVFDFLFGGYGGHVSAPLAQGEVEGSVSGTKTSANVEADLRSVEIGLIPALKHFTGLALSGQVSLDADVDYGIENPKESAGMIRLQIEGLETLEGSESKYPVPAMLLGSIDWELPVEDGKLIVRNQRLDGPSLVAELDGEIVLASPPSRSLLNLRIRVKPTQALLKKDSTLALILNNFRRYLDRDGYYAFQGSGTVKRPRFTPVRR